MNATLPVLHKATIHDYYGVHNNSQGYVFYIEQPNDYLHRHITLQNPARSATIYCKLSNLTPTKIQYYPMYSIVGRKNDEFLYYIIGIYLNDKEVPYYTIQPIHHKQQPTKQKISHEDLILCKLA